MKPYKHYITGSLILGISSGMISLLARWITSNAFLSSSDFLVKYGLLGGVGYTLMGAFSLFLFGMMANSIRKRYPDLETLGDLLKLRLEKDGYIIMSFLVLFLGLDSIFMQTMGAAIFLDLLFGIPFTFSLTLFLLYCFVVAGLGGMYWIQRFEGISISFIFLTLIIIPIYFYVLKGVYPIYDGIRLFHPYLLFITNTEVIFFIFTALLIGFGQVLIDRSTWQRLYLIEHQKVQMTFYLTALIWSTIPLALSGMLMITIFDQPFDQIDSLLSSLFEKINPWLLHIVFLLFCFCIITTTIKAELHATTVHFIQHIRVPLTKKVTDQVLYRDSYLFSALLLVCMLIITHILSFDFIELLFFFGHLYASLIPAILMIIFARDKVSRFLPYTIFISWGCGVFLFPNLSPPSSIWICFFSATILAVLSMLFSNKT